MPNLFEKARAWLPAKLQQAAGETVTYTRGGESHQLTAVVGRTAFVSNERDATRLRFGDADFLIRVSEFPFEGTPQLGDRITRYIDGAEVTFEIQTPGPNDAGAGEPEWRYSDPGRTQFRIHTKSVSA